MAARPIWKGQLRLSLVSLAVELARFLLEASSVGAETYERERAFRFQHLVLASRTAPPE